MSDQQVDQAKRTWLIASGCAGAIGGVAAAVPFVSTFAPSERAKAAGAAVEVDVSALKPGEKMTAEWRGKPVWVVRRSPEQLKELEKLSTEMADPNSDRNAYPTPDYAKNLHRSIKPEYLVTVGICTHLGCSPSEKFKVGADSGMGADWPGGFLCPCHGSIFDLAGRVYSSMPAPDNLEVPPHQYLADTKILVGDDGKA